MVLLINRYGIDWTGPQKDEDCKAVETAFVPRGYGPKGVTRRKFSTAEWAKRDDVKKAWSQLADEHGLTQKEMQDVDRVFGRPPPLSYSLGMLRVRSLTAASQASSTARSVGTRR